jgi:MOSC domain-containing protein YiiM
LLVIWKPSQKERLCVCKVLTSARNNILEIGSETIETGIIKTPATGPINISFECVGDDAILNRKVHGGADQAVYVYGGVDYEWWSNRLGRELPPGIFGENLTITDLESSAIKIGDLLEIGSVMLEVTAPRIPCIKLANQIGDPTFPKRFREARRPGLYCRVITPGSVCAGDPVQLQPCPDDHVTIEAMIDAFVITPPAKALVERILAAPIAILFRGLFEAQLQDESFIQNMNQRIDDRAAAV